MCNKRYEIRHRKLWGLMGGDSDPDNMPVVISYFHKRANSSPAIYSYNVFTPPETQFKVLYEVDKALAQMQDKLFTKKLTKLRSGRKIRNTLRKDISEHNWTPDQTYDYFALMHYLRQCKKEGAKKCLLSGKEYAILNPETKKEKRKRQVNTALRRKIIDY